jgi:outer membrane protein
MFAMLAGLSVYMAAGAQTTADASTALTLAQAETTALANQPRMLAAQLRAHSSAERLHEVRAGYLPTVAFNATGVRVADTGTSTAAGT